MIVIFGGLTLKKADIVIEGGGIRCIGFIGALCYLYEIGYEFNRFAGVSAGAIISALVAAGYSPEDVKYIFLETDFPSLISRDNLQSIPLIGKPLGLLKRNGIYSSVKLQEWLNNLLLQKSISTFSDLYKDNDFSLKIIGADITKKRPIIFPDNLINYGIDPMSFPITKAIAMSTTIPFYVSPIPLNYENGTSYIIDGGALNDFPIEIFDCSGTPRWPTFCIRLETPAKSKSAEGKNDVLSYMFDIADIMLTERDLSANKASNLSRSILVPSLGVSTTDFKLSLKDFSKLFKAGYESAKRFIDNWDFETYIKEYR